MDSLVVDLLACPECLQSLDPLPGGSSSGVCCRGWGALFPEKDGVVLLLPRDSRSEDLWQETATQLAAYLESHPDVARRLLTLPPDELSPADRYYRGLILEERGQVVEGRGLQEQAMTECYTDEWQEGTRRQREWTVAQLRQEPEPVVDMACGTGTLVEDMLAETQAQVVGTDISPRVLRRLRRRCAPDHASRLTLLAMDARRTAFRDDSLYQLTTFEGLLNIRQPAETLAEVRRLLRGDFWALMSFYPPGDRLNGDRLREMGLEAMGFRSSALAAFAAARLEADVEFETQARVRPTPVATLLEGATLDALPVADTELQLCVVHARRAAVPRGRPRGSNMTRVEGGA
jgi:uncharacterized protein YbaR (Trm112 family)